MAFSTFGCYVASPTNLRLPYLLPPAVSCQSNSLNIKSGYSHDWLDDKSRQTLPYLEPYRRAISVDASYEKDNKKTPNSFLAQTARCLLGLCLTFYLTGGVNKMKAMALMKGPNLPAICGVADPSCLTPVTPRHIQAEEYANYETRAILSIDGGGIRGLLPCGVLEYVEMKLQKKHGPEARIADYFHIVSGTSAGALIAVMLTTDRGDSRPLYTAKEAKAFFIEHSAQMFAPAGNNVMAHISKFLKLFIWGAKYDNRNLDLVLRGKLQDKRLCDTTTSLAIPAFDEKKMRAVNFSSNELDKTPGINAKLYDICLGTTAAPTYFQSHSFSVKDPEGNLLREHKLIDGGVVFNNPATLAIHESLSAGSMNTSKLSVLSLGTGSENLEMKYQSRKSSRGDKKWFRGIKGLLEFVDVLNSSSTYKDQILESALVQIPGSKLNYVRIQPTLSGAMSSMDLATHENIDNLLKACEETLKDPVTREELDRFVESLCRISSQRKQVEEDVECELSATVLKKHLSVFKSKSPYGEKRPSDQRETRQV